MKYRIFLLEFHWCYSDEFFFFKFPPGLQKDGIISVSSCRSKYFSLHGKVPEDQVAKQSVRIKDEGGRRKTMAAGSRSRKRQSASQSRSRHANKTSATSTATSAEDAASASAGPSREGSQPRDEASVPRSVSTARGHGGVRFGAAPAPPPSANSLWEFPEGGVGGAIATSGWEFPENGLGRNRSASSTDEIPIEPPVSTFASLLADGLEQWERNLANQATSTTSRASARPSTQTSLKFGALVPDLVLGWRRVGAKAK